MLSGRRDFFNHPLRRTAAASAAKRPAFRAADNCTQLDDTHQQLRTTVARFAAAEVAPLFAGGESEGGHPPIAPLRGLYARMGALGLHGVAVSADDGGLGMGLLAHCVAVEELSRASPALGLSYGAHSNLCVGQIARHGSAAQRRRLLPRLLRGEAVGALAMTEPDAGTDVLAMRTRATRTADGAGFVLEGSKTFITNAGLADVFVVYAKTAPERGARGVSCFVVDRSAAASARGFGVGPPIAKLGMRGCPTAQLTFDGCFVPAENLLGTLHGGADILRAGLDTERLVLAAGPVGILAACVDLVLPYVSARKQFGQPVGRFQLVQAKLAEMHAGLAASRALVHAVARAADASGRADTADCAAAIMFSSEQATKAALDAVQCLGGYGYTEDYAAGRLLRDAKLYEIGAGTAEIRRVVIAHQLLRSVAKADTL